MTWHDKKIEDVLQEIQTDPKQGLSQQEAEERLKRDGLNELPKGKQATWWQLLLRQFANPLIYILVIAAAITSGIWYYELTTSGHSEAGTDAIVIMMAVLVNVAISFYQEYQAGNIFKALAGIVTVVSRVVRGGGTHEVDSKQLAQGDIILLAPGMKVPADARLLESRDLKVNEALLTGESEAADKQPGEAQEDAGIGDRHNMVFMGTVVERGEGRALVVGTGARSELGKIAQLTQEAGEGEKTPLQERVTRLGKLLTVFVTIAAVIIFVTGIIDPFVGAVESFVLAVAVAVAGIPEGLPAALAVVLTVSMRAIYRKNGLVKKLIAAETLGSVSVICSDKTGTLTEGVMKLEELLVDDGVRNDALKTLAFANEAIVEETEEGKRVTGESTDRAKLEYFIEAGGDLDKALGAEPRVTTVPFTSENKYLASFHEQASGVRMYVSGAPEVLLERAKGLSEQQKGNIQQKNDEYAARGFRMIAVGWAETSTSAQALPNMSPDNLDKLVVDLTFGGLAAIRDPIRVDVKDSLRVTRGAGVHVVMITGDHVLTAKAIGAELDFSTSEDAVMEGKDIDALSDEELKQRIPKLEVFARVNPEHKMRIVDAWQAHGQSVAMTGDGVNDAPALKAADIGIAVGAGTDVTKEAADLVLLNDSFTTITEAIKQGRIAFDNIRKVVVRVLSNSFTELILVLSGLIYAVVTRNPDALIPVTAAMILWTNLVEDSLPDFSLAFEPGEEGVMQRKPLKRKAKILNREAVTLVGIGGLVGDLILLSTFFYLTSHTNWEPAYIQTFIFGILGTNTLFFMFAVKSFREPIWRIKLFANKVLNVAVVVGFGAMLTGIYAPFANNLLGSTPLELQHLASIPIFGVLQITLVEIVKWLFRRFRLEVDEEDRVEETASVVPVT